MSFFKKNSLFVLKGSMCCWNDALQQQVQVQCKAAIMACLCGEWDKCNMYPFTHWHISSFLKYMFIILLGIHGMRKLWWRSMGCRKRRFSPLKPSDWWTMSMRQFPLSICFVSPDSEVSKRRSLLSVSSLHRLWSLKYYVFNFCSVLWTFPLPVWRLFCSFSCFWQKFGSSERLCKRKVNKYVSESTIVTSPAIHVRSQRRKAMTLVLSSIGMLSYLAVNNSTNIKGNKVEDRQYYIC